jgi:capsular polysaccharide biosynthesis protein
VDLWDLAKLMGRRWYLMAPMLLLTIGLTAWSMVTLKPDYTSTGTIILVPPADRTPLTNSELASTNTWVELGEDVMAQAIAISVRTKATREEIANDGFDPGYEVEAEARSNLITITVTSSTPEMAQSTVQRVEKQIATEVQQKQAVFKPKPGRSISTQVLDAGDTIEVVSSKVKRAAVVIIGAGLLLTAAVTIVGDVILRRRARTRSERKAAAARAVAGEPPLDGKTDVISSEDTTAIPSTRMPPDIKSPIPAGTASAQVVTNGRGKSVRPAPAGAGLAVNYRQADSVEPEDATIVIPLGGTPWAGRDGRDKDAEARKR